jgi:hypothetical protein
VRREPVDFSYSLARFTFLFLVFFLIRSAGYGQGSPWWASLVVGAIVAGAVWLVEHLKRNPEDSAR